MSIAIKLESACLAAAKLQSFAASVNLYKGSDSPDGGFEGGSLTTVNLPCAIFHVESSEKYVPRSQARRCRLRTIVRTSRDDEQDSAHRERAKTIFDWVLSSGFEASINNYAGLGILLVVEQGETESQVERKLESVLEQQVDCVPFDIT